MRYLIILLISTSLWAQDYTPTYSTARVQQLAAAIGHAEGFGKAKAKPTRNHNPGDLKTLGKYRVFRTDAEGWAALQAQIVRVLLGHSRAYTLETSINLMGRRYAGSPLWARNVAKRLGVPGTTTLRDYLCNGDLDVPPWPVSEAN